MIEQEQEIPFEEVDADEMETGLGHDDDIDNEAEEDFTEED